MCPFEGLKSLTFDIKYSVPCGQFKLLYSCLAAMEVYEDHECVICKKPVGASPKVTLGEKGSESINKASKERNESLHCTAGQQVQRNIVVSIVHQIK